MFLTKTGIDIGALPVILDVRLCTGYKREVDGSIRKEYAKELAPYPLQVITWVGSGAFTWLLCCALSVWQVVGSVAACTRCFAEFYCTVLYCPVLGGTVTLLFFHAPLAGSAAEPAAAPTRFQ